MCVCKTNNILKTIYTVYQDYINLSVIKNNEILFIYK